MNKNNKVTTESEIIGQIINSIFSKTIDRLPSLSFFADKVCLEGEAFNIETQLTSYGIRCEYTSYSFPLLTDEFLTSLSKYLSQFKKVSEIAAGTGWLSYWLSKYGIRVVDCIDNNSWCYEHFGSNILDIVKEYDAVKYVEDHPEIEAFILSWPPYDDPLAFNVWRAMKPGQILLFIGEDGGCCADDDFFNAVAGHKIDSNLRDSYSSFWGIHDRPITYRK